MADLENDLRLSTAAYNWSTSDRGPRLYTSASDAVGYYLRLSAQLEGCPAFDYSDPGMFVQSQPLQQNPHYDKMSDLINVEEAVTHAKGRARRRSSGERDWTIWVAVQVRGRSLRMVDISSTHAQRIVRLIDGWVESALSRRGLMVYGDRDEHESAEIRAAAA